MLKDIFKKAIRSLQVFCPRLMYLKTELQYQIRHTLRIPHESDFRVLAHFHPQPAEVLIDVGANRGQSIESMLLNQRQATIVSFEPNSHLWPGLLNRYNHMSNVRLYPIGLSDSDESVDLFVPIYRGFVFDALASVKYTEAYSWLNERTLYGFSPRHLKIERYCVQLVRLDTLQLQPALIKIDVQGTELNVVRGALETIRKHLPVLLIESVGPQHPITLLLHQFGYYCYAFRDGKLYKNEKAVPNSFLIHPSVSRFDPEVFAR